MVPVRNKFCGTCGTPMNEETRPAIHTSSGSIRLAAPGGGSAASKKTLFFGAMQQARAKLVLIKGDGLDGVSFTLAGDEHVAGRLDVPLLFEEDPFLSPRHANFFYRSGDLLVRDEESVNGVYTRIRSVRRIDYGDRFLIGEQVLEVQPTIESDDLSPEPDGTYFYASPRRAANFRIIQLLRGGDTGLAFRATGTIVTLGREGNDIDFPDDPFISGRHAKVEYRSGQLTLGDLGSKNGTFLRVNRESKLEHGDYVFMGQQLLRVEIV
jgi:pSer/pThr/pTyr-binding forkhead associated (FHA) protein